MDKQSIIKAIYLIGILYHIQKEKIKGISNINNFKKIINERIKLDKKSNRISDDFEMSQNDINEIIDIFFSYQIIGLGRSKGIDFILFHDDKEISAGLKMIIPERIIKI